MKIILLSVGKVNDAAYNKLMNAYAKKLTHYIPFEIEIVPDIKHTKNLSEKEQKTLEGKQILKTLQQNDYVILLDAKGKEYTSPELTHNIEKKGLMGLKRLIFVVGGPYGFSEDMYNRADEKVSLSKMTFTHEMVRLVFMEQLYRAMTILNNEPYHHE
ncbi:MAG TPA: 23S rRNA (pseudouridine(1915)-N(3))-methyltransferase RlmH [Dysgonamonadaceae bacterium]|nr:23S rRNA (pseudouridine(1915)-N(3))-methyltransferase RlmH [Dysgonamonadaceae bacterium]